MAFDAQQIAVIWRRRRTFEPKQKLGQKFEKLEELIKATFRLSWLYFSKKKTTQLAGKQLQSD
jgi:hypothetical protein